MDLIQKSIKAVYYKLVYSCRTFCSIVLLTFFGATNFVAPLAEGIFVSIRTSFPNKSRHFAWKNKITLSFEIIIFTLSFIIKWCFQVGRQSITVVKVRFIRYYSFVFYSQNIEKYFRTSLLHTDQSFTVWFNMLNMGGILKCWARSWGPHDWRA